MTRKKKILLTLAAIVMTIVISFLLVVGPWPTYGSGFKGTSYYRNSIAAIEEHGKLSSHGPTIGRFQAGWSVRSITPPIGTPMAGFGARQGRPSTGVHDEIFVKALAVGDSTDFAAIVGSDMLIVPENVADAVRARVAERTPLTPNEILFNASHNHSGPGAFGPGYVSKAFNGAYDPKIVELLTTAFTEAIVEAHASLKPAKVAHGAVDAPEYIRNRTRKENPVDSELDYMLIEREDGERCFLVRYSAHPTILSDENMEFTGEYPGFLMRHLTEKTGAEAIYLAGAVGSMSHRAPEAEDRFERARAMGAALGEKILETVGETPVFEESVDVGSIGVPIELPPLQLRLNKNWRLSKFFLPALGVDTDGWMQVVRIGNVALVGTPADYCGEISLTLRSWAEERFGDMWVLSFNGDYVGYISPDAFYYDKEEDGTFGYERGVMSWIGPHQEAYTVFLIKHAIDALFPESQESV